MAWATRNLIRIFLLLAVGLVFGGCANVARRDEVLHSWKWHRDKNIVMQGFDYSCGSAALATLMRYYFGDDTTEMLILMKILTPMTSEEVRDREKNGLSLLDLKRVAERMGYQATGVKLRYASLPKLRGPVIIHVQRDGYKHFAVLKGVRGDRVFLADPSLGNIRMSIDRFAQEWTGVALVLGKQDFGLPTNYPMALDDQEPVQNELLAARQALYIRP